MIKGQHHVAINVSERERSVAFYKDVLGFELESELARPERGDIMIMMRAHGVLLEIFVDTSCPARPDAPEALGLRHLCFEATDIEAEHARVKALGYEPEPIKYHPGTTYRLFFVKDPDGLPIEFHE